MSFSTKLTMTVQYLVWIDFDLIFNFSTEATTLDHDDIFLIQKFNKCGVSKVIILKLKLISEPQGDLSPPLIPPVG